MTRERDIERVLDAWFEPGPRVMPDRLFDDVLGRVERVPQRGAVLGLRALPISGRRSLGLAAAVLVVGVVGLTVFNRPDQGAAESALPDALQGRWVGPTKGIQARAEIAFRDLRAGTMIDVYRNSLTVSLAYGFTSPLLSVAASSTGDGRIRLDSDDGGAFCSDGDTGLYRWEVSASGRVLTISEPSDECSIREDAIAGTWWKVGCPMEDGLCLGELDSGTYRSQVFDPFLPVDEFYMIRFGALSYSVPGGWSNSHDAPGDFKLRISEGSIDSGVFLASEVVIAVDDFCFEEPETVRASPEDMTEWLTTAPGVVATDSVVVTVGGLSGVRLDVSLDPGWTQTCGSSGVPTRGLFSGAFFEKGQRWALGPATRMRLFILGVGDGRTLVVGIEGASQSEFDALIDPATTIVESFEFHR